VYLCLSVYVCLLLSVSVCLSVSVYLCRLLTHTSIISSFFPPAGDRDDSSSQGSGGQGLSHRSAKRAVSTVSGTESKLSRKKSGRGAGSAVLEDDAGSGSGRSGKSGKSGLISEESSLLSKAKDE